MSTVSEILKSVDTSFNEEKLDAIMALDFDVTDQLINDLAFQGFDPRVIFNIVRKLIEKENSRKDQLRTLIVFGLTRGFGGGKNWEKIYAKSTDKGKQKLEGAVKLFHVQLGKPATRTTITVPRLMAAFPLLTQKTFQQLLNRGFANTHDTFEGTLPLVWRYAGSAAAMDSISWDENAEQYVAFMIYLSKLWGKEQSADEAKKYALLSFNSVTSPMDKRTIHNE
jgi:hypothetical protein